MTLFRFKRERVKRASKLAKVAKNHANSKTMPKDARKTAIFTLSDYF